MAEIKAIETIYNNYRFRSRLEARWAVFMDALNIEYQYEPEGYDLGDGYYYLPDFYIPKTNTWLEIKGSEPTKHDIEKMIRFAEAKCDITKGGSKFRLLQGGIPDRLDDCGKYAYEGIPCYDFLSVDECKWILDDLIVAKGILRKGIWVPSIDKGEMLYGLSMARQARFEHGECGM